MGLQKYRVDEIGTPYPNGSIPAYTHWIGGPSLALVKQCPTVFGPRTVYRTGEADTWFSFPAVCRFKGKTVKGYLTSDDFGWKFIAYRDSYWFPHIEVEE